MPGLLPALFTAASLPVSQEDGEEAPLPITIGGFPHGWFMSGTRLTVFLPVHLLWS